MKIKTKDRLSSDSYHYQRIEKAIQYLEDHVREQPGLDELGRAVHLSPFHLQRLFNGRLAKRKNTGLEEFN
jgi:AraC-like DNA-binding protein